MVRFNDDPRGQATRLITITNTTYCSAVCHPRWVGWVGSSSAATTGIVLGGGALGGTTCEVCTGVTVVGAGSGRVGSVEIRYCATENGHHWQLLGSAPTLANGAACATTGMVAITENGASAMAAAAAMPSAFIS
jgi:hypothetical protein